jgi:L-fuculose-phosphate aldolase
MNRIRKEYKQLVASYAARFVGHKLTPGMDSGDWSMKDPDSGLIYICPRPGPLVDITPDWSVLKDENVCVIDGDGKLAEDNGLLPTVEWPTHVAIYKARPDALAIVHGHPIYSSVFAVTGMDIPVELAEQAIFLGGDVLCAEYGLVGSQDLANKIVQALGPVRKAVLMRNHGSLVLGKDLREAFVLADFLEHGAHVSILARLIGQPISIAMDNILDPSLL